MSKTNRLYHSTPIFTTTHSINIIDNYVDSHNPTPSKINDSFLFCDDVNVNTLRKSEYDVIKKQDAFHNYNKTKKYIKKGSDAINAGTSVFSGLSTLYTIGKIIIAFK